MIIPDANLGSDDKWGRVVEDYQKETDALSSELLGDISTRFLSLGKSLNIIADQTQALNDYISNIQSVQINRGTVGAWTVTTSWASKISLSIPVPSGYSRASVSAYASSYCRESTDTAGRIDFQISIAGNTASPRGVFLSGPPNGEYRSWSISHSNNITNPSGSIAVTLDGRLFPGDGNGTFSESGGTLATITTFYR